MHNTTHDTPTTGLSGDSSANYGTSGLTGNHSHVPGTTTTTTTHTTTTPHSASDPTFVGSSNNTSANSGARAGESAKGVFAKTHGVGESLRGHINSAIDGFTGDKAGAAKNDAIIKGGEHEFRSGEFAKHGTTDKAL